MFLNNITYHSTVADAKYRIANNTRTVTTLKIQSLSGWFCPERDENLQNKHEAFVSMKQYILRPKGVKKWRPVKIILIKAAYGRCTSKMKPEDGLLWRDVDKLAAGSKTKNDGWEKKEEEKSSVAK